MYIVIEYVISFVVAFIVAFSSTPIAKKIAFKVGAIDIPKDSRRMHKKPIALVGGLAIFCGFVFSVLFTVISSKVTGTNWLESYRLIVGLLVGAAIVTFIGFIDDAKPLSAKTRLLFQTIAAISTVLISDVRIERVTNPFSPVGVTELSWYISYPLTILWIMGITNAFNFIDGLDGLAAGVSTISSLSLFLVSMLTPTVGPFSAIMTAALTGATLGFLPFNFNPAKIFMGSTGAYFLGFTLATVSIEGMFKSYTAISIAIPILALGLPLFDTIFAILRRLIQGKSIMSADRGHLHHKLIDMGLSHKQSVLVLYLASAVLGLCAIVMADKGALSAIILLITVSVFVIAGAKYMVDLNDAEKADVSEEIMTLKTDKSNDKEALNTLENAMDTSENKTSSSKTNIILKPAKKTSNQ
jgi:UDP-GlcNAc:undecaprenyl-phosphate GlcNAc-1-phosphate transferase